MSGAELLARDLGIAQDELVELRNELDRARRDAKAQRDALERAQERLAQYRASLDSAEKEQERLKSEIRKAEDELAEAEEEARGLRAEVSAADSRADDAAALHLRGVRDGLREIYGLVSERAYRPPYDSLDPEGAEALFDQIERQIEALQAEL